MRATCRSHLDLLVFFIIIFFTTKHPYGIEVVFLLGHCAASLGDWCSMFRESVVVSTSGVECQWRKSSTFFFLICVFSNCKLLQVAGPDILTRFPFVFPHHSNIRVKVKIKQNTLKAQAAVLVKFRTVLTLALHRYKYRRISKGPLIFTGYETSEKRIFSSCFVVILKRSWLCLQL